MLCFHGHASCNKKIVDFELLHVLLYTFSTRVDEIYAHVFLIHVQSTSFIMHSLSLTMYDRKRIPVMHMFGDNGYNTSSCWYDLCHTLCLLVAYWLCLGMLSS
jgi:hypothetical protein